MSLINCVVNELRIISRYFFIMFIIDKKKLGKDDQALNTCSWVTHFSKEKD